MLRTEIRDADRNCQLIIATLATFTGAIFLKWDQAHWYAGLALQVLWLFGIYYLAERRFAIARIAKYIREHIEQDDNGFHYETVMEEEKGIHIESPSRKKRPWSLPSPLYREIALGAAVCLAVPFISLSILSPEENTAKIVASFLLGAVTAVAGLILCFDYRKSKSE